jgi:hypothetical protein
MIGKTTEYPPRTKPDVFIIRARDRSGNVLRFRSIKAQPDFETARKLALRVAKRPDAHDVRVLRVPAER